MRQLYGYRAFTGQGARELKLWLVDQAKDARSNDDLARRFVEECRRIQIIVPAISTIERQCADALVAAERKIEEAISSRLNYEARARLDALLVDMVDSHLSRFVWLRQFEPGKNSADVNRLLDRLAFLKNLELSPDILADIPPHRVAV